MDHAADEYIASLKNQIDTAEALLTSWINASFFALTSSMLFYHVTRISSIKSDKYLAALIALALLGIGIVYIILGIYNYIPRTDDVLESCHQCSSEGLNRLSTTRNMNVCMAIITIGIELMIGYLISTSV
jgi:hypothetical protein